jgi:hypothetical protein
VQRVGNVVKADLPKERLYDFMELARLKGLHLHECSLKKTSLEDSFFNIVKGVESPIGAAAANAGD